MEPKKIYQDFIDLFSDDTQVKLNALLLKKDWILDRFYIPYSFISPSAPDHYSDLDCLLRSGLPFRKLVGQSVETKESQMLIDSFNKRFRYLKVFTCLPEHRSKDSFFVEADFRKLEKEDYKKLVASFFYCLPKESFVRSFPLYDMRTLFQRATEGKKDEAVIILDKNLLCNDMLEIDGFTKIYIYDDISEKEEELLLKLAQHLNLRTVMAHV